MNANTARSETRGRHVQRTDGRRCVGLCLKSPTRSHHGWHLRGANWPRRCDKTWAWKRSPGGRGRARRPRTNTSWSAASPPVDTAPPQLQSQTRTSLFTGKHTWQKQRKGLSRTVADFFHYERIEADLVDALVQAVGLIDLPQFFVEHHLLGVRQLRTQDPIVELLWEDKGHTGRPFLYR